MQITHEEARELIHLRADDVLSPNSRGRLDTHLAACRACSEFADQIAAVELTVRRAMQNRWNSRPLPLRDSHSRKRAGSWTWISAFLPTRRALLGITTALFLFTVWHVFLTGNRPTASIGLSVSPIPTPTIAATGTQNNFMDCNLTQYAVRENDTLESIARQYSVSRELILEANQLDSGASPLPARLLVPICASTPTGSLHSPATTTITPGQLLTPDTPG